MIYQKIKFINYLYFRMSLDIDIKKHDLTIFRSKSFVNFMFLAKLTMKINNNCSNLYDYNCFYIIMIDFIDSIFDLAYIFDLFG